MPTTWSPPRKSIFAMRDEAVASLTDTELVRLIQTTEDALATARRENRMGDALIYGDTLSHLEAEESDRRETRWLQSRAQVTLPLMAGR